MDDKNIVDTDPNHDSNVSDIKDAAVSEEESDGNKQLKDAKNNKKGKKAKKKNFWPLKITVITFCLSLFFSFISEIATTKSNIIVAGMLLILLILISIIFDGIGVSVTSCDLAPLNSMAARKVPHARIAIMLVKNAEKVNNICADVIGDICGIVSGACGSALVATILVMTKNSVNEFVLAIFVSAIIAALTVGGKAFEKNIAIKNSQEFVMFTARLIGVFYKPDRKRKSKNARKNK